MKNSVCRSSRCRGIVTGCVFFFAARFVCAESVTNNLDLNKGFVYDHGLISPSSISNGMTFTDPGIRDVTISAGQLCGVDPESGVVITNSADLLSLVAGSLETVNDIVAGGSFIGAGTGISNLNVSIAIPDGSIAAGKLSSSVAAASITTNEMALWNAAGAAAVHIQSFSNEVVVVTNLTVVGSISAAGSNGQFMVNQAGKLAGSNKLYIHEQTGKPAFVAEEGYLFRVYDDGIVSPSNLIYSLRDEGGRTVMRMFTNGVETVKISGDGTIELAGRLVADGSQLTNLSATNLTGSIPVAQIAEATTNSPGLLSAADKQVIDGFGTGGAEAYLLHDGSRMMSGNLNLNSNRITNLADAVSDTDAASMGAVKTLLQNVPAYGDLSMGLYTNGPAVQ